MNTKAKWLLFVAGAFCLFFWLLTRPQTLVTDDLEAYKPDPVDGEQLFHAGGCAACHGSGLEGGLEMATAFGTFRVPNISPDPVNGIGDWSGEDFLNAMKAGVSPDGRHYYPAFPYTSYTRMDDRDVLDLKAYIDSIPASGNQVGAHDIGFPWSIRRGIGLWKKLYLDQALVAVTGQENAQLERGRYLVEAVGHCGECHTPRNAFGAIDTARWLAGGPNPDGEGRVPNITPHEDGIGSWSEKDIAYYLESGFTPDFDMVGSSMVEVQENIARLSNEDRAAIAVYLKAISALPKQVE